MQNKVQVFNNEVFGSLSILTIDNKLYFPATECAKILGYRTPRHAISRHCKGSLKRAVGVQTGIKSDGTPAMQMIDKVFIPESDLYRLIVRSKLPEAKRFESWVCDEVLPTIRKYGAYITDEMLQKIQNEPPIAQKVLQMGVRNIHSL